MMMMMMMTSVLGKHPYKRINKGIHNTKTTAYLTSVSTFQCGPGSSVGIATELRAGRSGIESQWGRYFPPVQSGPGAHPDSYKNG